MAVNLHATHFRFGIEELLEATHGWHAAEDINPTQGVIAVNATFLLRFTVQETGGTAAANVDNQFQCRKNAGAWQDITTTSTIAKAVASVAFTNGQACTKRLTGTGTFESSGAGCTEDGNSGGAANDIAASGNSETECALQIVGADVAGNDIIEFRLTSPDFPITNDVVPAVTVAGATIVEADGASAGTAATSVAGNAIVTSVLAAGGVAASTVAGIALWVAVSTAAGLGTASSAASALTEGTASAPGATGDAVVTGAIAGSSGAATGAATALGAATNTEPTEGAATGVATATGLGAATTQADGAGAGITTVTGQAAIVRAGVGQSAVVGGGLPLILND